MLKPKAMTFLYGVFVPKLMEWRTISASNILVNISNE